jgi:hypothetical protein
VSLQTSRRKGNETLASDGGEEVIGLVMGGPGDAGPWEGAGDIYALYVQFDHQHRGWAASCSKPR